MPWSKRIPVRLSTHNRCRIFRGQCREATEKAIRSRHSAFSFSLCFRSKPRRTFYWVNFLRVIYCGLEESWLFGFEGGRGSAGALLTGAEARSSREDDPLVEGMEANRGASGPVVIALSGFSRWSWLGPRPSLIKARESGTVLDCQPWSA